MTNRTRRLSRLGNAVVPDCGQWLGERILEHGREAVTVYGDAASL